MPSTSTTMGFWVSVMLLFAVINQMYHQRAPIQVLGVQ